MLNWIKNFMSEKKRIEVQNTTSGKDKLEKIKAFISCTFYCAEEPSSKEKVFDFIRMLTDRITSEYVLKNIVCEKGYYGVDLRNLFIPSNEELNQRYNLDNRIWQDMYSYCITDAFEIDLHSDPILTFPWNRERLCNALRNYATPENPWEEHTNNHSLEILFPVGVSWFYNGIHSGFSGYLSREGVLYITPDSQRRRHNIANLAPLYDYIAFDGENYIFTEENAVIGKANSFELGCIFEIGRMLHENGIQFKDVSLKRIS